MKSWEAPPALWPHGMQGGQRPAQSHKVSQCQSWGWAYPPLPWIWILGPRPSSPHMQTISVFAILRSVSFCLFALFIYCFQLYVLHMSEIIWFLTLIVWLFLLSLICLSFYSYGSRFLLLLIYSFIHSIVKIWAASMCWPCSTFWVVQQL